jgi:hypothetical protein
LGSSFKNCFLKFKLKKNKALSRLGPGGRRWDHGEGTVLLAIQYRIAKMVVLRSKVGFSPDFGEYSNVGSESASGKGKTTLLRHLQDSTHLVAGA